MSKYETVSIVIPVYNERSTIEQVISQVQVAPSLNLRKEIILVDDYSTDGSRELLKNINNPALKVFYHGHNQGKGAALKTGFEHATGDIIVVQDADLEYDPADIQKVLDPFFNMNAEVVYGSRYLNPGKQLAFWHSFFNKLFTRVGNLLIGQRITDLMTCYKAFTKPVLQSFLPALESKRFGFEPEVTARVSRLGYKIIEVPVSYNPRSHTEGKHMNLKGQLESLSSLLKYSLFR